MKVSVDDLLKSKPSKELIFNSVLVSSIYWKRISEKAVELERKQEEERKKLLPTSDLYEKNFTV